MMSNNAFVVSYFEVICLAAEDAWQEYCAHWNIKDPWREMRELRIKSMRSTVNADGSTSIEINKDDETEKKIKEWEAQIPDFRRVRDNWKMDWIFENEGYEVAGQFARMEDNEINHLLDEYSQYYPCAHLNQENNECSIFCRNFEECVKEGFKHWN